MLLLLLHDPLSLPNLYSRQPLVPLNLLPHLFVITPPPHSFSLCNTNTIAFSSLRQWLPSNPVLSGATSCLLLPPPSHHLCRRKHCNPTHPPYLTPPTSFFSNDTSALCAPNSTPCTPYNPFHFLLCFHSISIPAFSSLNFVPTTHPPTSCVSQEYVPDHLPYPPFFTHESSVHSPHYCWTTFFFTIPTMQKPYA